MASTQIDNIEDEVKIDTILGVHIYRRYVILHFCPRLFMSACPEDPTDLLQVLKKVNCDDNMSNTIHKMYGALVSDDLKHQANMIIAQIKLGMEIPQVVIHMAIMEEYLDAGKTKEALLVYRRMLHFRVTPNGYTYSVLIKALTADPDPNFHGVAKEFTMDMMGKGMQPNASTITAVFEAFAGQEKMEEAEQFLKEVKANGFVVDNKTMKGMRQVLKGMKGPVVKSIIDAFFGKNLGNLPMVESICSVKFYTKNGCPN